MSRQIVVTTLYYAIDQTATPLLGDIVISDASGALTATRMERLDDSSPVQLYLLIDNCSDFDPGSTAAELRDFLESRSPDTEIGNAYIRDGHVNILYEPSRNRERLIQSLTPRAECKLSSPFRASSELIDRWEASPGRRVVVFITNGIDPEVKLGYQSDTAEAALEAAQRPGVIVYGIYHPSRGFGSSSYETIYSGQVLLAHLAIETVGNPISRVPAPSAASLHSCRILLCNWTISIESSLSSPPRAAMGSNP